MKLKCAHPHVERSFKIAFLCLLITQSFALLIKMTKVNFLNKMTEVKLLIEMYQRLQMQFSMISYLM